MNTWILPKINVDYLDNILLDEKNNLKILPLEQYAQIPHVHLMLWAVSKAIYVFPTTELIAWLQEKIAGRKAIEICAGNGSIGRALNIPATDSFIQTTPEMRAMYQAIQQPTTKPPADVYKFEANEAVDFLRPKVVVGAYVTQLYENGDNQGSVCGVDEFKLLSKIETYIMIGNGNVHGQKRLLQKTHEKYQFPWLVCRSQHPELNAIWLWDNLQ